MICPGCAHENRAGAKFCEECAAALPRACASCGAELRASAKFCDECGAPVAAGATSTTRTQGAEGAAQRGEAERSPTSGARKVVTIVFADLVGSTALHERLDAESVRQFMASYYGAMRSAVEAHGGRVTQLLGDGVKAVFGAPRVAEDDAIRAVRAAVGMQRAFRVLAAEQASAVGKTGLRVAVNTGEVIADGESEIIGDPVNVAARLQEQGRDGDVVIGDATQRIVSTLITVAPLGSFTLKGRAEQVKAHRVVSLEPPEGVKAASFVGREHELARLDAVHQAGLVAPRARLAVLLGSPGLGKSRLIDEFARRLGDSATIITAHCDAAGGGTFAPLAKALRTHFKLDDSASAEALRAALEAALPSEDAERTRIAGGMAALLAGTPAAPEETFFVVRRLLGALAAAKPVVLVIDDLHWAEPLLLDLVEHLVRWGAGARLMLLVGARPELRDTRVSLTTPGGPVADVVTLAGLDASAAMRLAASVIGAEDLPTAVAAKLLAASEGNPLFVGELVRMLVEEGALRREGERWTIGAGLAELQMPPTIHALLAARIERLRPEERSVIEHAAVIGRHFSRSAVAALMPGDARELDARIESLWRSELIEPDTGWFLGEPALRFHHVLIRDAAYRRLLKHTRVDLHARLAEWIEARAGEDGAQDETLGWHFEQAHQCLRELGPIDARGRKLGERAAKHLAAAGRRALARDDLPLAASLLGRALDRLDPADPARADLALDWCEALLSAGDVSQAATAIDELGRFIHDSERLRAWHTCFAGQRSALTDPQSLNATALAVAAAAEALAALGDAAGEAKAHQVHAQALARLGRVGACEAALDRALAAARRPGGDRRRANAVLAGAPLAALWGPSPVTRASGRCLDVVRVLRITQDAPAVEAIALSCQGVLEALRGRTEAARRMVASSRKMVEELGIAHRLFETDAFAARIDLLEGDAVAAEARLRSAYDGLRELGLGVDAAQAAALLARALLAQGRAAEAEALSHESEALAGDGLQAAIAWRGVRAEALARRGEHAAAVALAEAAVEIASATDALLDHADARLALAAALRAAGRNNEASAEERRAIELWEAKGATLLAERARREGVRIDPVAHVRADVRAEPARAARRRIRSNAATENCARLEAAIAARDLAALPKFLAASYVSIHHPTGTVMGPEAPLAIWRALLQGDDPALTNEILATLGDSLALVRGVRSSSAQREGESIDVGAALSEEITLVEVDARGQTTLAETFAPNYLGDAIARLYARYAELLPEGAERTRAEAMARSVAAVVVSVDPDLLAPVFDPSVRLEDHRVLHTWSARGAEEYLRHFRLQLELAPDFAARSEDVLALEPRALLSRATYYGTAPGGGAFENHILTLWAFGADGLLTSVEVWEPDHQAEALARFDALTGAAEPPRPHMRRVRANAATAMAARIDAVVAARDAAGYGQLIRDDVEYVDHPNGLTFGRDGMLATFRSLVQSREARMRHEPLASLRESLGLMRRWVSSGTDEGAFEAGSVVLVEADESARLQRSEMFADDKLGDAIARLYARYAELLPEGAERTREEAIARSVAASLRRSNEPADIARYRPVLASTFEFVDHRVLGTWSAHSADAHVQNLASWQGITTDAAFRTDHLLALEADALLVARTLAGAASATGGAFERPFVVLSVFGSDGLAVREEYFDVGDEAEALARFDELTASSSAALPPQRLGAGFENAATRAHDALNQRFNARDWAGIETCVASELVFDERRRMLRNTVGRRDWLRMFRFMFDVPASRFTWTLSATRGERLALHLLGFEGEVAGGGGPLALDEHFALNEVDRDGRIIAIVLFDLIDEAAAYAELDARYEAQRADPPARAFAAHRAEMASAFASGDWDPVAAICAPEFIRHDHRLLGLGVAHGQAALADSMRAMRELAPDARQRVEHVRNAGRGELGQVAWVGTRDGGPFEIPILAVSELDERGRYLRLDMYDLEQQGQARARFDALASRDTAPPAEPFANAASRAAARMLALGRASGWQTFVLQQSLPEAFRFHDRRRLALLDLDREGYAEYVRSISASRSMQVDSELIATRGERLALERQRISLEGGDVGVSELVNLSVYEVDERGECVALVRFDEDDLDAAYAELDARYQADEARVHPLASAWVAACRRAFAIRDWDALGALASPQQVAHNHRLVGWDSLRGPAGWVPPLKVLAELAPDVRLRIDHLRTSELGIFWESAYQGSRDGGPFEIRWLLAVELNELGTQERLDIYDPEQHDQARARFEEIAARTAAPPARFENAATRTVQATSASFRARDWKGLAQYLSSGLRYSDRRKLTRVELDRDGFIAFTRSIGDMARTDITEKVLATRGDRLALSWVRTDTEGGDVGPSEIESLSLSETNAQGEVAHYVRFDVDALLDALAELDARWEAGEAALHTRASAALRAFRGAIASRDWPAFAALLSPAFACEDHRKLGFGTLGGAAYVELIRSLTELSPDVQLKLAHVRTSERVALLDVAWQGTRDGGAFETPATLVAALDVLGKFERIEVYDPHHLARALARFEELGASAAARDPLRIPPNAATRALDGWYEGTASGDMAAVRALYAESYSLDDRRALMRGAFDLESAVANARFISDGWRWTRTLLATAGDRLALWRILLATGEASAASEIEILELDEVDREGRIVRIVLFDPDARAAASEELFERYVRLGADGMPASHCEILRAICARDPARMRAALPDDYFVDDHRRLGLGRLASADAYVASIAAMIGLSRELRVDELYQLAVAQRARLSVARMWGTNSEGGEFETYAVWVALYEHERFVGSEYFDLDAIDAALARFEELGSSAAARDPLRIPPNAATRASDRFQQAFAAEDWDAQRALASADFRFEDRTKRALVSGDVETWIRSGQYLRSEARARIETRLLATLGDRIAIHSSIVRDTRSGDEFELERVRLVEVDAAGKLRALTVFDSEDRGAAFLEAEERFVAGEAVAVGGQAPIAAMSRSIAHQDWPALRECLTAGFEMHDLRTLGLGLLARDSWVDAMRTLAGLGSGVHVEYLRALAWNRHGRVSVVLTAGLNESGGPFEILAIGMLITEGDRVALLERYDLADVERALARFEALCAEREARA